MKRFSSSTCIGLIGRNFLQCNSVGVSRARGFSFTVSSRDAFGVYPEKAGKRSPSLASEAFWRPTKPEVLSAIEVANECLRGKIQLFRNPERDLILPCSETEQELWRLKGIADTITMGGEESPTALMTTNAIQRNEGAKERTLIFLENLNVILDSKPRG